MCECSGVTALVALLAAGVSTGVQTQAAGALTDLCLNNAHNCNSVRDCGGIVALVGLLAPGGSAAVRRAIAGTLRNLCSNNNNQNRDSHQRVRGRRGTGRAAGARRLCRRPA